MTAPFRWLKGHGTENDFVLLPDLDGGVHGDLATSLVRDLCHRRRGIGADGVLRVVRRPSDGAEWYMDYRNADGSLAQMCGNGIRVVARFLEHESLVDTALPLPIGTRDGVKTLSFQPDGRIRVEMGVARVCGEGKVSAGGRSWAATYVDVGNPHAVAVVDSLADAGPLREAPAYDRADFPEGVNVEFVDRESPEAASMLVYERGVGETRACGTGACAVALVTAGAGRPATVTVTAPGGAVDVTLDDQGRAELIGPAVLVAEGTYPVDNSRPVPILG